MFFYSDRMMTAIKTVPARWVELALGRLGRTQPHRSRRWLRACLVGITLVVSSLAYSASADEGRDIRRAVEAGDVVPIEQLFVRIHEEFEGRIVKAELERKKSGGRRIWIYEFKLLTPQGDVLKLKYDAKTMELLKVKGPRKSRDRQWDDD